MFIIQEPELSFGVLSLAFEYGLWILRNRAFILNACCNRMRNKIKGRHSEKMPTPTIDKKPIKRQALRLPVVSFCSL